MLKRNLGKMGESFFENMCASCGIISNKSTEDYAGWDYTLDFPDEYQSIPLADKSSGSIECKIQIKSTDKLTKRLQIKLSNMLRFCKSEVPAFILFLEYNGMAFPQNAYLVHIDRKVIYDVLKVARANSISKNRKSFNKITYSVRYCNKDLLAVISGESLKEKIESYIPSGMGEYARNKRKDIDFLGYEKQHSTVKFNVNGPRGYLDLVDATLGWTEEAKIQNFEFHDDRFGLSSKISEMSASSAVIKFDSMIKGKDANIIFKDANTDSKIRMNAEVIISPFNIPKPNLLDRIRIKTIYIDMLINFHDGKVDFKYTLEVSSRLHDLKNLVLLLIWLETPFKKIDVEVLSKNNPHSLMLNFENKKNDTISTNDKIKDTYNAVLDALELARLINLEGQIKTHLSEVYSAKEQLSYIGNIIRSSPPDFMKMKLKNSDEIKEGSDLAIIVVFFTKLGEYHIYTVATYFGVVVKNNDELLMSVSNATIEKVLDFIVPKNATQDIIKFIENVSNKYERQGINICVYF